MVTKIRDVDADYKYIKDWKPKKVSKEELKKLLKQISTPTKRKVRKIP